MYHGIRIIEESTALTAPITGSASIIVAIGTAPVNMVEDPAAMVNTPFLANNSAEARAALGYSNNMQDYTLCQEMYAASNLFAVSPVVYINVL
ncbi:MAG: phage tail sheath family protein, partial [Lachnospiraceae bacterium]|nr:phage tail sheath family protein [Lachnospiraceae bacterium]